MSRAFVKEDVDSDAGLPERTVSSHPNFVTPEGLLAIEAEVMRLNALLATAKQTDDKIAAATLGRDLRYWQQRRASAELVSTPDTKEIVQFGSTVAVVRDDGRRQSYRIVGEDEADPKTGTVSHVSPLAQAVLGRRVGDEVVINGQDAEIVAIS